MSSINIYHGDICSLKVDAIVNAANESLLGGGGVDGAIHRAAGSELLAACRPLNGCPTGQAKMTPGFNLPARFVIHTVGPIWQGGDADEDALLASCYDKSLALAIEHDCKQIAFPCISTGVYRFPKARAMRIALVRMRDAIQSHPELEITCCCFSEEDAAAYRQMLRQLSGLA